MSPYCILKKFMKKGEVISIISHEGPRGMWMQKVHKYTDMTLGRDRVASAMLGRLYSSGNPPVFIL